MAIEPEGYLHLARFVVPMVDGAPDLLVNGAVLTRHGRIVAVGPAADFPDPGVPLIDHGEAVLLPPLVNCHCHLELSHLAGLAEDGPWFRPGEMAAWIENLLNTRGEDGTGVEEQLFVARQALAGLYARGCIAVADIGNEQVSADIGAGFKVMVGFFREVLGMTAALAPRARELAAAVAADISLTAHSAYGTAPDLIQTLKQRAGEGLFSIHLSESLEELEFVALGSGPLAGFMARRGGVDPAFSPAGESPPAFLDRLGVLDRNTLCVHCVHVNDDDIKLLAARGAGVCLCPGSNRYLGVGTPPVAAMLAAGIRPGLGTDSLASNDRLDLWQEMKILARMAPEVDPGDILRMATSWGSDILGLGGDIGRLAPGFPAVFPAVRVPGITDPDEVFSSLVRGGGEIELEWVQ